MPIGGRQWFGAGCFGNCWHKVGEVDDGLANPIGCNCARLIGDQCDVSASVGRLAFEINDRAMEFSSRSEAQAVRLAIDFPWSNKRKVHAEPNPPQGILVLNGTDLGRDILESLDSVRRFRERENARSE